MDRDSADLVADLVQAAAAGDQEAWNALVERYAGLVWAVTRAHRLDAADAADVAQTTWLRLVEHLPRIREPQRLGGWLATTARRECLRVLRAAQRSVPLDASSIECRPGDEAPVDARLLDAERDAELWEALQELPERCWRLLRVLLADPPLSYEEVSSALAMPVGSIGPTRIRCLRCLRERLEARGVSIDSVRP